MVEWDASLIEEAPWLLTSHFRPAVAAVWVAPFSSPPPRILGTVAGDSYARSLITAVGTVTLIAFTLIAWVEVDRWFWEMQENNEDKLK